MTQASVLARPTLTTENRAVTYLEPRPTDGTFGIEIVTTQTHTEGDSIKETTTTTWHGVDPRDGIIWSLERAALLLAVLGYRCASLWSQIPTTTAGAAHAWGVVLDETKN